MSTGIAAVYCAVRYLRMLSNSLIASALAAAYVFVLVLQLNPALPAGMAQLQPLAGAVLIFYIIHFSATFYTLLVLRQLFSRELFSPAWVSLKVLSWLASATAAAGA